MIMMITLLILILHLLGSKEYWWDEKHINSFHYLEQYVFT
jgi:hypothetical protein